MYQVSSTTVFFFVNYMHIHMPPLYNVLLARLFVVVFQEINMPIFVGSQSFISLPSFMFVSAVVSEIRELKEKEKEKNSELTISNFTPFLGIYI